MSNPWEEISLDDYEKHMSLDSVRQLQALDSIMKKQFAAYPVETAAVLGVAGGNGLEHITFNVVILYPEITVYKDLIFRCEIYMYDMHSRDVFISSIKVLADLCCHVLIACCLYRIISAITIRGAVNDGS